MFKLSIPVFTFMNYIYIFPIAVLILYFLVEILLTFLNIFLICDELTVHFIFKIKPLHSFKFIDPQINYEHSFQ